ncbi:HNH endonuclease [Vibrio phage vB_VspP_pVa5]|uniref:HNH homing endonuclease protein n=1 Tax=Vibrio phage vB_VspP_pVa5 TaxID=1913109 RepID=A0A1J0GV48_9CAUD|nr:HNH endonuclease [Vibrio phage vB_VspP_pVa5]APC46056.1 HNH homing endonuclease protein [Vibrio phage vB_VspP_pVa5]
MSVCNIGFIGPGPYPTTVKGKQVKCYRLWVGMLGRCYNPKTRAYRWYGAKGVTVCDAWHDYQVFAAWCDGSNYFEGAQLDKDVLHIAGSKHYSPYTCKFVTPTENKVESRAKQYTFKDPQGNVVSVYNLRKFCRDNRLHPSHMAAIAKGKGKSHKGWTKA